MVFSIGILNGQTLEELNTLKADRMSSIADLQAQIDAKQAEVDGLQKEIDILSGWRKGYTGIIGLDWNKANGWVATPNPRASSSSLAIGLTGFMNRDVEKIFWHNKGILSLSWQDIDKSEADSNVANDGLFDNRLVDIVNLSSLAGYKITDKFGISGQAELNTSVFNFLSPGTFDIGLGVTWLPMPNLTVTVLPLNYHAAFSGISGLSNASSIGAKLRVDYYNDFNIAGLDMNWTSTLTSFIPYSDKSEVVYFIPDDLTSESFESGLFEYTWLNTLSFNIWKGIGVGIGFGLRKSDFEGEKLSTDELEALGCEGCLISGPKLQSYTNIGLSYNF